MKKLQSLIKKLNLKSSNDKFNNEEMKATLAKFQRLQIDLLSMMICEHSEHYFRPEIQPKEFEQCTFSTIEIGFSRLSDFFLSKNKTDYLNSQLTIQSFYDCVGLFKKLEKLIGSEKFEPIQQVLKDNQKYLEIKNEILNSTLPKLLLHFKYSNNL